MKSDRDIIEYLNESCDWLRENNPKISKPQWFICKIGKNAYRTADSNISFPAYPVILYSIERSIKSSQRKRINSQSILIASGSKGYVICETEEELDIFSISKKNYLPTENE